MRGQEDETGLGATHAAMMKAYSSGGTRHGDRDRSASDRHKAWCGGARLLSL